MDITERFWSKVRKTDGGCWIWESALLPNGYGVFSLRRRTIYAHRLAYEFCVGPIPTGMDIDHLCRNRACVNPSHLEPVTRSENLKRGHLESKFTAEDVRRIRALYASGEMNQYELARMFNTAQPYISNIILRHVWDYV